MPNNDHISRASVLEAIAVKIQEFEKCGEQDFGSVWFGMDTARELLKRALPVTDSLSVELELSPIGMTIRKDYGCYTAEMFGARGIRFPVNGRTPLEAVMKLKEALNSNSN